MKKLILSLFIVLLLTPAFLWIYNSKNHLLGSFPLQEERSMYTQMRRISATSYPVIHNKTLFLISITDQYIYEMSMEEDSPVYVGRYDIGGKGKVILHQDNNIVIGYQNNQIKTNLVGIKTFNLNTRKINVLAEDRLVTGDFSKNMVLYNGWIYTWNLENDKIFILYSDGEQILREELKLPIKSFTEVGFRFADTISNLPLFEVRGESRTAFFLTPKGSRRLKQDDNEYGIPNFNKKAFEELIDSQRYSRFYISDDYLIGRHDSSSEEWESTLKQWIRVRDLVQQTEEDLEQSDPRHHGIDVYRLSDFKLVGQYLTNSYLYPEDLITSGRIDLNQKNEAVQAQQKVVTHYQKLLDENSASLEKYMMEDQLKKFLLSPTSFVLILSQISLLIIGYKILLKGGGANGVQSIS